MKHKKLNTAGLGHILLPLLIVVVVAIGGSYALVASHAAAKPPKPKPAPHAKVVKRPKPAKPVKPPPAPKRAKAAKMPPPISYTTIDVSTPQCSATTLKNLGQYNYGVVGLNGTRLDFSTNSCVTRQVKHFNGYALYVGTNYPSSHCSSKKVSPYQCGQKAGQYDIDAAQSRHLNTKTWWLDVETGAGIPWSTTPSQNTAFLHGLYDTLQALPGTNFIGLYSTTQQWDQVTGGARFSSTGNWYATGPNPTNLSAGAIQNYCSQSFAGGHTSMVQYVSYQDLDTDVLC